MSRIGRLPIPVPSGVDVNIDGRDVTVKGPKGTLSHTLADPISADRAEDGSIQVVRPDDENRSRALHGLSLVAYRRASEAANGDPFYLYQQADVLINMGQYAQALDLLDKALQIDNKNAHTWAKHGQVLRRVERVDESLRSFTRAVELSPDYAWAWNGRGLT